MTREELFQIGRSSALEALDQVELYGGRENAVESYRENLWDTLRDLGLDQDADAVYAADDGFNSVAPRTVY